MIMREVVIIGVGMTPFGQSLDKSLMDLGREATWRAIEDANVPARDIGVAYVANSIGGLLTGQEAIRGQVILNSAGLCGIPIINVENACAGGTTALRGAFTEVALGLHEVALALGVEKMFCDDTPRSIKALATNADIELARLGFQFTAIYAMNLKKYMKASGATKEHFAKVVVKNSYNGSLNPYAQHRKPLNIEEVLNSRTICDPLTLYMCASMSDGAAAAIVCSKEVAKRYTNKPLVEIAGCTLRSGMIRPPDADAVPDIISLACDEAYNKAGIGPEDIDVAEVHDAMAPAELMIYEELSFCKKGEGPGMIDEGRTMISGDIPVNPSGGLAAKGHPVSATGLAQVSEIVWQLRGEAGKRQVASPKVGLIENAGGWLGEDNAACTITILKR
jgi:acetyl-CoA acyltransferase